MDKDKKREYNKRYRMETRQWRKEHNICVRCGCEDAAEGYVTCEKCIEKQRVEYRANKEKHYARTLRYAKKRREAGLCVICGKKQGERSTYYCDSCRIKKLAWQKAYNKKRQEEFKKKYEC